MCTSTYATEETKILGDTGENVIVRDIGGDNNIICYKSGDCSYFTLVSGGVTSTYKITLSRFTINDFEVNNDTMVYFCGERIGNLGAVPVMGYFSITPFPYSTVYYIDMPWLSNLKKLEVDDIAGNTHVVMVGQNTTGYSTLVDAIDQSSIWSINYSVNSTKNEIFYDVAITENYVYFTSIKTTIVTGKGKIWTIQKPIFSNTSIFSSSVEECRPVFDNILAPFLIEGCRDDFAVAAAQPGSFMIDNKSHILLIPHCKTTLLPEIIDITADSVSKCKLIDLKFYPTGITTDLLVQSKNINGTLSSIIYRVTNTIYFNYLISGHKFDGITLTSLDCKKDQYYHYVAAGFTNTGSNIQLTKYRTTSYPMACTGRAYDSVFVKDTVIRGKKTTLLYETILQAPLTLSGGEKNLTITTTCGPASRRDEDDDEFKENK